MQSVPMDFERVLQFEGCFNFRDLGGYATTDGRWVQPRRLYRADGPHAFTEKDRRALAALGLATVIDLRTKDEAAERGRYDEHVGGTTVHELPLIDVLPDAEELPQWVDPAVVARRYREMLDGAPDAIAQVVRILADANAYPAVFHCSAGKDRTGIVSAVLLGLVGVADDTIVADYALSARAMNRLVDHLVAKYPESSERLRQLAPALVAAEPATMEMFLSSIRTDFGSRDGYAEHIGVAGATASLHLCLVA
jgi:protein-tyrosine phosphatase